MFTLSTVKAKIKKIKGGYNTALSPKETRGSKYSFPDLYKLRPKEALLL